MHTITTLLNIEMNVSEEERARTQQGNISEEAAPPSPPPHPPRPGTIKGTITPSDLAKLSVGGEQRLQEAVDLPQPIQRYDADGNPIPQGAGDDDPQRRGRTAGLSGRGDVPARRKRGRTRQGGGSGALPSGVEWSPQELEARKRPVRPRPPRPPTSMGKIDKIVSRISDSLARKWHEGRVVVQQPMIPNVITGSVGKKASPTEQANIIIKQQVKQTVNERKRRKKSSTQGDKSSIRNKRKEYNALKKAVKKRFGDLKKRDFKSGSVDIKRMKPKERKSARARLRKDLTDKLRALVAQMPSASKKSASELDALISRIKKLQW